MYISDYQRLAGMTARPGEDMEKRRMIAALGLTGEAGELAEVVKKEVGHGHPEDREKIAKELGDVMWYVAAVASTYGLCLENVAEANIAKLRARYPEGFSTAASIARVDLNAEVASGV